MFENIGTKIKNLAKWFFIILTIINVLGGIILIIVDDYFLAIALPAIIAGPVFAYILAMFLYGFGQLIENSDRLVGFSWVVQNTLNKPKESKEENANKE